MRAGAAVVEFLPSDLCRPMMLACPSTRLSFCMAMNEVGPTFFRRCCDSDSCSVVSTCCPHRRAGGEGWRRMCWRGCPGGPIPRPDGQRYRCLNKTLVCGWYQFALMSVSAWRLECGVRKDDPPPTKTTSQDLRLRPRHSHGCQTLDNCIFAPSGIVNGHVYPLRISYPTLLVARRSVWHVVHCSIDNVL